MSQKSGAICFLLALYGPVLGTCFRAKIDNAENRTSEGASWCNPFSSQSEKTYYFDVRLSGDDCESGVCEGFKFIRNKDRSVLKIHHGRTWTVKKDSNSEDELAWKLKQWNPAVTAKDRTLKLVDMNEILFKEGNKGQPDTIQFKWGNQDLEISGGLFYDTEIVKEGLRKIKKQEGDQASEDELAEYAGGKGKDGARKDIIGVHTGKIGAGVTAGVGAVGIGGYWAAAAAAGIAVSNSAMAGAAMAGVVAGAAAGGIIGLVIGGGIGLASMAGMITLVRDKGLSASEKIWSKIECMNEFKSCYNRKNIDGRYTTLLVPKNKACPE